MDINKKNKKELFQIVQQMIFNTPKKNLKKINSENFLKTLK